MMSLPALIAGLGPIWHGVIVGVGAIVAGRLFSMPHASRVGVISVVVVFVAAIAYLILPGMLTGLLGVGCI